MAPVELTIDYRLYGAEVGKFLLRLVRVLVHKYIILKVRYPLGGARSGQGDTQVRFDTGTLML